jgi:hypothetical protein
MEIDDDRYTRREENKKMKEKEKKNELRPFFFLSLSLRSVQFNDGLTDECQVKK